MQPRLLERIQQRGKSAVQSTDAKKILCRSIMHNSFNILSTRQKSAIIRDDMGMPEFHDLDTLTDDTLYYVSRLIITQLQLFEKRLQNIQVVCVPDYSTNEVSMALSVEAAFIFENEFHPIKFESDYFNDGKLVLRT